MGSCSAPTTKPGGDLLFHRLSDSTIGAVWFHGRVRDGIGWGTDAMTTKLWGQCVKTKLALRLLLSERQVLETVHSHSVFQRHLAENEPTAIDPFRPLDDGGILKREKSN